jgi:two-component system, sensor histidine kinase
LDSVWLAREIAVLHGGSIDAHSAGLGHGATFRVRLPHRAATGSVQPFAST